MVVIYNIVWATPNEPPSIANRISRDSAELKFDEWVNECNPKEDFVSLSIYDYSVARTFMIKGSWE